MKNQVKNIMEAVKKIMIVSKMYLQVVNIKIMKAAKK